MSLHRSFRKGGTRLAAVAAAALLSGCLSDGDVATKDPSFYRSMAASGAQVDAATAASMISGYRKNNGLDAISVDPDFANPVTVPDGFIEGALTIPQPKNKTLYIKLRDAPGTVDTAVVPMLGEQP